MRDPGSWWESDLGLAIKKKLAIKIIFGGE
jgi:hypothetical protein